MIHKIKSNDRAIAWTLAIFVAVTALYIVRPMGSSAKSAAELQNGIARKQARKNSLQGDIQGMSGKISGLRGRIAKLQSRQNTLQSDLDAKASRQERIANDLKISRGRLARLKKQLAHSRKVLSARIVELYKQGEPNMIQVVLSSRGFADMVERATYMQRIASQDRKIIVDVSKLKSRTDRETVKLAGLEREASRLVAQVKSRRDEVAGAKGTLAAQRNSLAGALSNRKSKLAKVSSSLRDDQEDLAAMQASNNAVSGVLRSGGPIKRGSGQMIWPVSGYTLTSPFGARWGRLHAGLDLAIPLNTAVRAADAGTVRIAGWTGGYGNYVCIQHSSTLSSCYAHNNSLRVKVGQSVKQGQVIAASGSTGNSTGPHVHFETRVGGNPVDPMGYL